MKKINPNAPQFGYITFIYHKILDNRITPDISQIILHQIFKYFREYLLYELLEKGKMTFYGVGTFTLRKTSTSTTKRYEGLFEDGQKPPFQYHVKFAPSANFTQQIRLVTGTLTKSEKRRLADKKAFMDALTKAREDYVMLKDPKHIKKLEQMRRDYVARRKKLEELKAIFEESQGTP